MLLFTSIYHFLRNSLSCTYTKRDFLNFKYTISLETKQVKLIKNM